MTIENFLKVLPFYEEVRILEYDNKVAYSGCPLTIPCEYYQREVKAVFSYSLTVKRKTCTCIIIK